MTAPRAVLAVDVGGTTIKAALVDRHGRLLRQSTHPTPVGDGPRAVVDAIRAAVVELAEAAEAVGVVVPGDVDAAGGVARFAANLGWRDVPLRDMLASDTGLAVTLDHDVRAAGLAERTVGAASECPDCLVVVIGTGIAGVIVSGGAPLTGTAHLAGEIGHLAVWPDGRICACGQRGCLEEYASAAAIGRRYSTLGGATASAREVARLQAGEPLARRVWLEATDALGIALASATMLLDPALIVLGGGLSDAGDNLLGPVRSALAGRITWREVPRVELSPLGSRSGRIGAAIIAWQSVGHDELSSWATQLASWSGSQDVHRRADQPDHRSTSTASTGPGGGDTSYCR